MNLHSRRTARAFAPAHITGLFAIYPEGSTGAGLNLADGSIADVTIEEDEGGDDQSLPAGERTLPVSVFLNGTLSDAPVSRQVLHAYREPLVGKRVTVRHETKFPVGYGLGMSGAGAFSLSLALNEALGLGLSFRECQLRAHNAELHCGTGLGTVTSQEFFGMMIGTKPYPSKGVVMPPSRKSAVVCAFFDPIETASIIRNADWKAKINATGLEFMQVLEAEPTAENIIALSRRFVEVTGLAGEKVKEAMRLVPEASMAMLGQTAFALTDRPAEVAQIFQRLSERVVMSSLATHGACVL